MSHSTECNRGARAPERHARTAIDVAQYDDL